MELSSHHLQGNDAATLTIYHHQGGHEPLLVYADSGLQHLLEEDLEHRLAGDVGHKEGPGHLLAPKAARAQATIFVAAEDDAHVLQLNKIVAGLLAHDLDGVLISQVVATFDSSQGMVLPVIASAGEGCVDAALGGVGVASDRMHLGDHSHIGTGVVSRDGSTHTRQPRSHHQHIVLIYCHAPLPLLNSSQIYQSVKSFTS